MLSAKKTQIDRQTNATKNITSFCQGGNYTYQDQAHSQTFFGGGGGGGVKLVKFWDLL